MHYLCDTSVLNLLDADSYSAYGNTLINFAEKISLTPFPFASGISGSMRQMKHRILNITNYQAPTTKKKIASNIVFILIGSPSNAGSANKSVAFLKSKMVKYTFP